jgi:S-methylmethionine-dependent homocysteine/selenocysteine methylase
VLTHPDVVKEIHRDYIAAGADIVTANTFRTNPRTFKRVGRESEARAATIRACTLAREAREETGENVVAIGGSVAPVEDCYDPSIVPPDHELVAEHTQLVQWLIEGGVDFIFIETMNTVREAVIASKVARATGYPFMISFVCDPAGNLLSGEPVEDAVVRIEPLGPTAFLTNCRPPAVIGASLARLIQSSKMPVGVYANGVGQPDDIIGWRLNDEHHEDAYMAFAEEWIAGGASILGGCCGTSPAYTRLLRTRIDTLA